MTILRQFGRFAVVGGLATAIHYVVLIILVQWAQSDVVFASSVGFLISAVFNYLLNRRITFRSQKSHLEALPRFFVVAFLGLLINAGLIWVFHDAAQLHYLAAQILATAGTLFWNFTANRIWTFGSAERAQSIQKEVK